MRTVFKAIGIIAAATCLGIAVGSIPMLLRGSASAAPAPPQNHGYRAGFHSEVVSSPQPRVVKVVGVFQIGTPATRDEVCVQQIRISDMDKNVLVNEELGRVIIPAGRGELAYPYKGMWEVPQGTYFVEVFSYQPGTTLTDENGVVGLDIGCRSNRLVSVR